MPDFPIGCIKGVLDVTYDGFATVGTSESAGSAAVSHRELTTVLTTTMTTVGLSDATYMTRELVSCLGMSSACDYRSEDYSFEAFGRLVSGF